MKRLQLALTVFCVALPLISGCGKEAATKNSAAKAPPTVKPTKEVASSELRVIGEVPSFALTDQDGQPFEKSDEFGVTILKHRAGTEMQQTVQK